jgi:hypothetical protein
MRSPRGQIMGKGQIKTTHSLAHTETAACVVRVYVCVGEKHLRLLLRRTSDALYRRINWINGRKNRRPIYFIRPLGCTEHHRRRRWRYIYSGEMPRCNYPDCAKSREGTAQISPRWYNIMSLGPFAILLPPVSVCSPAVSEFAATRSGCCVVVSLNLMKYACGLLSQLPESQKGFGRAKKWILLNTPWWMNAKILTSRFMKKGRLLYLLRYTN